MRCVCTWNPGEGPVTKKFERCDQDGSSAEYSNAASSIQQSTNRLSREGNIQQRSEGVSAQAVL